MGQLSVRRYPHNVSLLGKLFNVRPMWIMNK